MICKTTYIMFILSLSITALAVEEASYKVLSEDGRFELRDYDSCVIAEVVIESSLEDAGNAAFRPLFKYISGANTSKSKIAMTAPVSQEKQSEKIAMTAPVSQEKSKDGWAVSFMMPANYTMDTLPVPENKNVILREVPGRRVASVTYSGRWTEKKYNKYLEKLEEWIKTQGLTATGSPVWARYNPPFTLWFLRRNEILIPIEKTTKDGDK